MVIAKGDIPKNFRPLASARGRTVPSFFFLFLLLFGGRFGGLFNKKRITYYSQKNNILLKLLKIS